MKSEIDIRLFIDDADHVLAPVLGQEVKNYVATFADNVRLKTEPYWKIPEWSELFLVAEIPDNTNRGCLLDSLLSSLGKGWERHGAGDEPYQWAVWNHKPDCTFRWDLVRWANVELFPQPMKPESSQLLQSRIRHALLHEWDPIGIQKYPGAQDEYDSYVFDVFKMLWSRATEEEVLNYLWWLETQHMGLHGQRERTESFAKRLLEIRDELLGAQ